MMSPQPPKDTRRYVAVFAVFAFLLLFIRTAWVNDDAYITFRTIDNFLHGFGLRWNINERVQTYTHPLWMLMMLAASAISGEMYYTSTFISIGLSLLCVVLTVRYIASSVPIAMLALSLFGLSKSFV